MKKCIKCGKKSMFLAISPSGLCNDCEKISTLANEEHELIVRINKLNAELEDKNSLIASMKEAAKNEALDSMQKTIEEKANELNKFHHLAIDKKQELESLNAELEKSQKTLKSNATKVQKLLTAYKSLKYAVIVQDEEMSLRSNEELIRDTDELLSTTIELRLHYMDIKQLKALFNQNKKLIDGVLEKYKERYTTKTNMALYQLMVVALEAELQNVLYNIKFGKLDNAINNIKDVTAKYQKVAINGNQNIASTMSRFIGEIEYLFIEAIRIEYAYFIQKERIKEEQRALREQMRQEAEERKQLEIERKKIEKEEEKYKNEIATINNQITEETDGDKIIALKARIDEINIQLSEVELKKEEITNLQHGKAGYVYVISNLGSFGDNVFKVGMTRRLEPQDRINELSNASVPFPFDVHSFIFSDDAVGLEHTLHKELSSKRINKINSRKEFFRVSIDEIEELVFSFRPTAEFSRTLLAEQYNQSLSIDEIPDDFIFENISEDDYEDGE